MFLSVFFLRNSLQFKKVSLPLQPQTRNNGAIAQLVEQRTENPCVPGSIPGGTTFFFRSGFKISIENDSDLRDSEIRDISQYILSNKAFVRQLMSLGFDTLIIMGKTTKKAMQYSLKEYAQLGGFSLE